MSNSLKRFLSMVVAMVMVIGMVPGSVFATESESTDSATIVSTAEALTAAIVAGGEITLGADITLEGDLTIPIEGNSITLDLDNHTLAFTGTLTNNRELTIKDGTVTVNKLLNHAEMFVSGTNTIQVEDATGTTYAIRVNDGAVLNDSYIKSTDNATVRFLGSATLNGGFECAYLQGAAGGVGGTITIEEGTTVAVSYGVEFSNNYTINGGTIKLSGGNASGGIWGCVFQSAEFTINSNIVVDGGDVYAPIYFTDATATVNGSISQANSNGEPIYIGDASNVTFSETSEVITDCAVFVYGNLASAGNVTGTIKKVEEDATIAISGGTYTQDVSEWCVDGYSCVDNGDGTYGTKAPVAKIGTTYYTTLAEAINAAADGATVTLLCDITTDNSTRARIKKPLTLDLGGHTITSAYKNAVAVQAGNCDMAVTIKNGTIVAMTRETDPTVGLLVYDGADVTLENLTIENGTYGVQLMSCYQIESNTSAKETNNYTSLVLNDGVSITATADAITSNGSYPNTAITINEGATVTGGNLGIYHPQWGSLTINGGTITGATGIYMKSGSLSVTGGTIIGNGAKAEYTPDTSGTTATGDALVIENVGGNTFYFEITDVSITGGTFTSANGSAVAAYACTEMNPDAEAVSKFISGGTFSSAVTADYCAAGYIPADNGNGTYGVAVDPAYGKEAKIGETYYATLAEAIAAAQAGETVTLLADIQSSETYTIPDGKSITLDLNGKVVSGTCTGTESSLIYVENDAALTIKDSKSGGKLTFAAGSSNTGYTVDLKGALTLESGTIELTGTWNIGYAVDARPNSWGTEYTKPTVFTMNGGNIVSSDGGVRVASSSADTHKGVSASFVMNGGKIDAAWDGVFIQQSDVTYDVLSFTMNGGTIESDLNPIRVYGPAPTGYVNGQDCMDITLVDGTLTYTGTETREWIVDGILRVGGGSSADTIIENGTVTVSATFTSAVPDGYKWVEDGSGNYTLVAKVYVAAIGEVKYETLQAAIDAAAAGDTITLLADVTVTETLTVAADDEIILDLNSKTLSGNIHKSVGHVINNSGTLTIQNGTLKSVAEGGGSAVYNAAGAKVTLEDLTIYGGLQGPHSTTTEANTSANYPSYAINNAGTLTADTVTICSYHGAVASGNGGVAELTDVTIDVGQGATTLITSWALYAYGTADKPGSIVVNSGTIKVTKVETAVNGGGYICTSEGGKITVNGGTFTKENAGGNNNNSFNVVSDSLIILGGTFDMDPAAYVADGYAALKDLDDNYVVGKKPTATVNNLGAMTISAGDYTALSGGNTADMPLSFVMQFLADQDAEDMETSPYADWYADFVLTFTGLESGSFEADGCYLAGYYGDFGWVKVPVDDMTIEEGARYPVMLGYGAGQKYDYICESVKDFRCALYLTDEILEANPDIQVNLELSIVDNSKGEDDALAALASTSLEYVNVVGDTEYTADNFAGYVAQIGTTKYKSLAEALAAAKAGDTVTLLADITISEKWDCRYNGAKITVDNVTIDGDGHKLTFTGAVNDSNWNTVFRFEGDNATVKNLTIDASAATDIQRGISTKLSVTVDNCVLIGNGGTARRAIIFGEGAGTAISGVTATVTNSTFTNWSYGVSDNQNAQDAESVTVTGNTFNNAGVLISASESVTFTGNSVNGKWVNISSYSVPNELSVTATGNTLTENTSANQNVIRAKTIDAQVGFATPVAELNGKYYTSIEAAIDAAAAGDTITLLADVTVTETLTVAADDQITLDLNGKTVSMTDSSATGAYLIKNYGDLTITDSATGGKLTFNSTTPSASNGYSTSTIGNGGKLTVAGGTIENTTVGSASYAIDTLWYTTDVELNITGGTITTVKSNAVRQVLYSTTAKNTLNVSDGTITGGYGAIQTFCYVEAACPAVVNISGGTLTGNGGYAYFTSYGYATSHGATDVTISGGTFNGEVYVYNSKTGAAATDFENVAITGGTFKDAVYTYTYDAEGEIVQLGTISGGTFSTPVEEGYCVAGYIPTANTDGTYGVKEGKFVVRNTTTGVGYETIDAALAAAVDGDKVFIYGFDAEGNQTIYEKDLVIDKAITVEGETGENGYQLVSIYGALKITADGATVKGLYVYDDDTAMYINAKDVLVENCELVGAGWAGLYQSYTDGTVTFKDSTIVGYTYGIHFDGSAGGEIVIDNCKIQGWTSFASTISNVTIEDSEFLNGYYNQLRFYQDAQLTNVTFNPDMTVDFGKDEVEASFTGCSVTDGSALTDIIYLPDIPNMGVEVTIENVPVVVVAMIGDDQAFLTLADAIAAAEAGDTVTIRANVTVTETLAVTVKITLDLGGKTVTGSNGIGDVIIINGGDLTIKDSAGNGAIVADTSVVYDVVAIYNGGVLTVEGGSLSYNGTNADGNIIYADNGSVTIKDGTFNATVNYPIAAFDTTVSISGGTFSFQPDADYIAYGCGAIANSDGTYTVQAIDPVAYIGTTPYYTLEEAIEAAAAGDTITVESFTHSGDLLINKAVTLEAAADATVQINGQLQIQADGVTVKGIKVNSAGTAVQINAKNVLIEDCEITGSQGLYQSYTSGTVTFKDSKIVGTQYAINFGGSAGGKIVIDNCDVTGWVSFADSIGEIEMTGSDFAKGNGAGMRLYNENVTISDCTFDEGYAIDVAAEDAAIAVSGTTVANGTVEDMFTAEDIVNNTITVDGVLLVRVAKIGETYYKTLAEAIAAAQAGETITLLADIAASEIITTDKAITLDGNGHKLTSTAGRAINVDCDGNVAIKNLTIEASGERAINVINQPANLTIDNVTATAANYTLNVATSAGAAQIAVTNSTLTGACTVNVSAAGADVAIDASYIYCVDDNTTEGESYAALSLNKDATGGSIIATDTTVSVTTNSDSTIGRNSAENGTVTLNGSTAGVTTTVAIITYAGSDYYHGFETLAEAIEFASEDDTITLIRDIESSEIITIDKAITLDGNGHKLTSTAGRAINVDCNGDVVIENLTIDASGERAINVINQPANLTIDNVTATADNYTLNVATSAGAAQIEVTNSKLTGACTVNVAAAGAYVAIDASYIYCVDDNTTLGESYAALSLNKDATGGSIIATNTAVSVTPGSDSTIGRNSAEDGIVTLNGTAFGVTTTVAIITYAGSDYYYGFETLAEAIEFASEDDTITLIRDIESSEIITIDKAITLIVGDYDVNASFQLTTGGVLTAPEVLDVTSGVAGHVVQYNDTAYVLAQAEIEYAASIGETKYETLQEAIEAVQAGETIQLLKSDEIAIVGKPVTIQKNDYTATVAAAAGYTVIDAGTQYQVVEASSVGTVPGEGLPVAYIDANNNGQRDSGEDLQSLKAALNAAASGDIVRLYSNLDLTGENIDGTVIIPSGVTLDIQSYTLTAKYVVGLSESYLTANPNAGILKVTKGNIILSEQGYVNDNGQYVLPIWDPANGYYLFSLFVVNTNNDSRGLFIDEENETIYFQWKHQATTAINDTLLSNGASDNELSIVVRIEWYTEDGLAYQDFTYSDSQVGRVTGKYDYTATLTGFETLDVNMETLKIYGMVVTESGATAFGTQWTVSMDKDN